MYNKLDNFIKKEGLSKHNARILRELIRITSDVHLYESLETRGFRNKHYLASGCFRKVYDIGNHVLKVNHLSPLDNQNQHGFNIEEAKFYKYIKQNSYNHLQYFGKVFWHSDDYRFLIMEKLMITVDVACLELKHSYSDEARAEKLQSEVYKLHDKLYDEVHVKDIYQSNVMFNNTGNMVVVDYGLTELIEVDVPLI